MYYPIRISLILRVG